MRMAQNKNSDLDVFWFKCGYILKVDIRWTSKMQWEIALSIHTQVQNLCGKLSERKYKAYTSGS
jgi:hypothetical protein